MCRLTKAAYGSKPGWFTAARETVFPLCSGRWMLITGTELPKFRQNFNLGSQNTIFGAWRDGSGIKSIVLFHRTHVQFLAPAWRLTTGCNSGSRESNTLFRPPGAPGMVAHRHTSRQNTQTHNLKIF